MASHLKLDDKTNAILSLLIGPTSSSSKAEVFRKALALLCEGVRSEENGGKLVLIDKDGTETQIIIKE